jgi:hypothetical protein
MADGFKLNAMVPWSAVGAAAIALIFMYRDVQHIKEGMISVERITRCEVAIGELEKRADENRESIKALWQARSRRDDR